MLWIQIFFQLYLILTETYFKYIHFPSWAAKKLITGFLGDSLYLDFLASICVSVFIGEDDYHLLVWNQDHLCEWSDGLPSSWPFTSGLIFMEVEMTNLHRELW